MMYIPKIKKKYNKEIVPALQKQFGFSSPMQVPRLCAIHLNQGLSEAKNNAKILEIGIKELSSITGQKAVPTLAKKSISNFKLRAGMPVGVKVTLRGNRMYEFLGRFVDLALPRSRDFTGINEKSFDKAGNYTCGIKEQIIFPEINIDKADRIRGLDITFVTSTQDLIVSYQLLKKLGLPFKDMHKEK